MEGLHWDSLSPCIQRRVWRPQHKENPNVDAADNLFNSDVQEDKSCSFASESGRASGMMQQLAPALDSINSNLLLHRQQAPAVTGTGWQEGLTAQLHGRPPLINSLYSASPLSSLIMPNMLHNMQAMNGAEADTLGMSGDSLDCLLSTTNSNTDTSVEDDGVSMTFSDCGSLWNFTVGSTGDSKNNVIIKDCDTEEACKQVRNHGFNSSDARPSSSKGNEVLEDIKPTLNHCFTISQSNASMKPGGFQLTTQNSWKKPRLEKHQETSNINFQQPNNSLMSSTTDEPDTEAIAQVKEMIYRAAVFRPVNLDLEVVEKPKRKNVRISSDPQTVAARQRRERISEKIRILQRLVPGGNKMDTASMLEEACNYLKYLRSQVRAFEIHGHGKFACATSNNPTSANNIIHHFPALPFNQSFPMQPFFPVTKP